MEFQNRCARSALQGAPRALCCNSFQGILEGFVILAQDFVFVSLPALCQTWQFSFQVNPAALLLWRWHWITVPFPFSEPCPCLRPQSSTSSFWGSLIPHKEILCALPSLPQVPRVCNETSLGLMQRQVVSSCACAGAKQNRAAWVVERRGGSPPGAGFASAENDLWASLETKDMCEPAPPEREELARVVSLPTSQKLSYRSTRVLKGTQTHRHCSPMCTTAWLLIASVVCQPIQQNGFHPWLEYYSATKRWEALTWQHRWTSKAWCSPREARHERLDSVRLRWWEVSRIGNPQKQRVGEWLSGAREKESWRVVDC